MANPVVKLRPVRELGRITGYVVWCLTDDCDYAAASTMKGQAQTKQRKHAMRHRADRNKTARTPVVQR